MVKQIFEKYPWLKKILINFIDKTYEYKRIFFGVIIRLPFYVNNVFYTNVIGGPKTLDYRGGVWNPGALFIDNTIILLAKGHYVSWWKARGKKSKYYLKGHPLVFLVKNNEFNNVSPIVINKLIGFPQNTALGDTRLFLLNKKIFINHSLVYLAKNNGNCYQSRVTSSLSILDIENKSVTYFGQPKLDLEINNIEKNWVYISTNNKLYLFYSINPYRVLSLQDNSKLKFNTIINLSVFNILNDPGGFGTMVSYSVNPIEYNDKYWLLIIHQIDNKIYGRCYYHWAVLLDKETLLPKKITSSHIFTGKGARGRVPGIRYITSIVKKENEILFFAGEGDIYSTVIKKNINELGEMFVDI